MARSAAGMREEPAEAQPKKKPQDQSNWTDWINGIISMASKGKTFPLSADKLREFQDIGQKERASREQRDVGLMRPTPTEQKSPVTKAVPSKLERESVLAAVDLAEQMTLAIGRTLPFGPKWSLLRWVEGGSRA